MKSKYCTCNIATYKPHCTYCGKQAYEANEGNYPPKTEKIERGRSMMEIINELTEAVKEAKLNERPEHDMDKPVR
jgi:hypothetical protein